MSGEATEATGGTGLTREVDPGGAGPTGGTGARPVLETDRAVLVVSVQNALVESDLAMVKRAVRTPEATGATMNVAPSDNVIRVGAARVRPGNLMSVDEVTIAAPLGEMMIGVVESAGTGSAAAAAETTAVAVKTGAFSDSVIRVGAASVRTGKLMAVGEMPTSALPARLMGVMSAVAATDRTVGVTSVDAVMIPGRAPNVRTGDEKRMVSTDATSGARTPQGRAVPLDRPVPREIRTGSHGSRGRGWLGPPMNPTPRWTSIWGCCTSRSEPN